MFKHLKLPALLTALISAPLLFACSTSKQAETEFVYINNGSIQCQSKGKTTQETASLLEQAGVIVTSSQCASLTNVMMMTMCGAPALNINIHEIQAVNISKAQTLGFESVNSLKEGNNAGYQVQACP